MTFLRNQRLNYYAAAVIGCVGVLVQTDAAAQSAGTYMVRLGATKVVPHVTSDDLTPAPIPGIKADLESNTKPSGGLTYMVTDNIALDVPISVPFRVNVVGAGVISGVGKLGDFRGAPVTLLGQYRFLPAQAPIRPYVGVGLTYAKFYGTRSTDTLNGLTGGTPSNPTTFSIASKFAGTIQAGASFAFWDRWFIDGNLTRTFLKTHATFSTGQTLEARLDPMTYQLAVGYRF